MRNSPSGRHTRTRRLAMAAASLLCACGSPETLPTADTGPLPDDPFCASITWHPDADGDGYGDRAITETGCLPTQPDWIRQGGDCDDRNSDVRPGVSEVPNGRDDDCNDLPDDGTPLFDNDGDGFCADTVGPCSDGSDIGDCDDTRVEVFPGAPEGCDALDTNCDGRIPVRETDVDQDGFIGCLECDDTRAHVFPGAVETCDGLDTNCDGLTDNADADADGAMACDGPGGSLDLLVVVDNSARMRTPQAILGDQADALLSRLEATHRDYRIGVLTTDATTLTGPSITPRTPSRRAAFDTAAQVGTQGAGSERAIGNLWNFLTGPDAATWRRPGAPLAVWILSNEDDQSWIHLDTLVADVTADLPPDTWRVSTITGGWRGCSTNIGRADPAPRLTALAQQTGGLTGSICDEDWFSTWDDRWMPQTGRDCDDSDPSVHPEALERADAQDGDCDGVADVGEDDDHDGVSVSDGDCHDGDPEVFPGAPERCNGRDDDCDGVVPPQELDLDGDRWRVCAGDCDDADGQRHPNAVEACDDGVDANCNGTDGGAADRQDADDDGYTACQGDCDDNDDTTFPWAPEHAFDGKDNDCDGPVDGRDLDTTLSYDTLGPDSLLTLNGSGRLFKLCGQNFSDVLISANGYILPGTTPFFRATPALHAMRNQAPFVAAGWTDLDPSAWNDHGRFLRDYGERAPLYVVQRADGMSVVWDGVPHQATGALHTTVATLVNTGPVHIAALQGGTAATLVGYACDGSSALILPTEDTPMCADPITDPVAVAFVQDDGYPARLDGSCAP